MPDHQRHTPADTGATDTDEQLLEQFLLGDDRAFTSLYERYDARVLTYLRTILKECPDVADDLFQETFVRLYRERERRDEKQQSGEYRPIGNFRGWLFRVAHNLAISHLRSKRRTVRISNDDASDGAAWDERLMVPIEESFAQLYGSSDPVTADGMFQRLQECIELLPPALREVYVLREINGLEYDEVAELAGCSQEAARMRISRARRALRKALAALLDT